MKNNLPKLFKSIMLLLAVTFVGTMQAIDFSEVYTPAILGVSVTRENCNDLSVIPGVSGTVKYDMATKTLTLENATITTDKNGIEGIRNEYVDGLKIELKGTNYITLNGTGDVIYIRQPTTITGYGELNLDGIYGIRIGNASSLLIDRSAVKIKASFSAIFGYEGTSLAIRKAHISATGPRGTICGMDSVTIEDAHIYRPEGATYDTSKRSMVVGGEKVTSIVYIGSPVFDVILQDYDDNETEVVNLLMEITGLSAEECLELAKSAPCKVRERQLQSDGQEICDRFAEIGAVATIERAYTWRKPKGIDDYGLKIIGVCVSSDNYEDLSVIPGVSGTVKYNPYTKKLTLDNATINTDYKIGIEHKIDDLKIFLKGTNYVYSYYRGMELLRSTTFKGGGNLNVESANAAICIRGNHTLIENCTVNAKGCAGLSGPGQSNTLTISNAYVTAEGENVSISGFESLVLENSPIIQPTGAVYDSVLHCVALDGDTVTSKIVIGAFYDIVLTDCGQNKIGAIKLLREIINIGLKECKELIESTPCIVLKNLKRDEAQAICDRFAEIGCSAEMYLHDTWNATGIETVEANTVGKGKRGIYSTGGIYLGNNMDALPKGLYIKDGKKVIK